MTTYPLGNEPDASSIYVTRIEAQRLTGRSATWLQSRVGISACILPQPSKDVWQAPALYRLSDVLAAVRGRKVENAA